MLKKSILLIIALALVLTISVPAKGKCMHRRTEKVYTKIDSKKHRMEVVCKDCGEVLKRKSAPHRIKVMYETAFMNDSGHFKIRRCSVCDEEISRQFLSHKYGDELKFYPMPGTPYHEKVKTCLMCKHESGRIEKHIPKNGKCQRCKIDLRKLKYDPEE